MNWTSAWVSMKQGHKVKRHHWKKAYWRICGKELMIHTEQESDINFREVNNVGMMLNVMCCDDWEVVEEENVQETAV